MAQQKALGIAGEAAILYEAVLNSLDPALRRLGISYSNFELLSAVQAAKGRGNQASLAMRLGMAPASLCEGLRACVTKGLVVQGQDPNDKRAKLVTMTPKGTAIVREVLDELASIETKLRRALGSERAELVAGLLRQFSEILSNGDPGS